MAIDNLQSLENKPFNDGVDVENLPAQMGAHEPPPQPGPFVFRLPKTLTLANFDIVAPENTDGQGQRLSVQFNDAAPLIVEQAHALASDRVGTPFKQRISNVARKRGKRDDPNAPKAADWDYLNQALGHKARPVGNQGYAQQLIADSVAEKRFGADVELSWVCNEKRAARFSDGQGGSQEIETAPGVKRMGCGAKFYQGDIDKVNGLYPITITCGGKDDAHPCGAQVRAFANLVRFRQV